MLESVPDRQAESEERSDADHIVVADRSHLVHLGEDRRLGLVVDPIIRKKLAANRTVLECQI